MKNLKSNIKKYGLRTVALGLVKDFERGYISEGDSPGLVKKLNKQRRKNESN